MSSDAGPKPSRRSAWEKMKAMDSLGKQLLLDATMEQNAEDESERSNDAAWQDS